MCGIIGTLSRHPNRHIDLVPALQMLEHRGPDDRGYWKDERVQLGHRRLSILDLTPLGHQPMICHQGRFVIVLNGEIYNYIELRKELENLGHRFISHTDTEVLLTSYSQWGISCLDRFRGMFAFAIWDSWDKTLFIARDRIGEKPLYYHLDRSTLFFSSELKALLAVIPGRPEMNPLAIDLYLHYQYVPEPRTALRGISKLQAGHYAWVDAKTWRMDLTCYWGLDRITPLDGDPIPLIRTELDHSIELTLRSDVPVGIALSGGIDSTAIASLSAPKYKDSLHAFSLGYPGHPPYDERHDARELADYLTLPFHDIELRTDQLVEFFPQLVALTDDPIADIAAFSHYSVTKAAADHGMKVMLTGIGGDELFWGYSWVLQAVEQTGLKKNYLKHNPLPVSFSKALAWVSSQPLCYSLAYNPRVPDAARRIFRRIISMGEMDLLHPQQAVYQNLVPDFRDARRQVRNLYHPGFAEQIPERNAFVPFESDLETIEDIPSFICKLLFDTWLVSNCLSLGDRVSMASSVESRMPLLDYRLIEVVFGLRKAHPDHLFQEKHLLKKALEGMVPESVLHRPKRGFQPPVQEWISALIQTYTPWLSNSILVELHIISHEALDRLLGNFRKRSGSLFLLYKVLFLETWYRKVILREE
jgi:asparagine synthase (glutamine-hydrolysing)